MIFTIVMYSNGKELWTGELPLLSKGQKITNYDGWEYRVVEPILKLRGRNPSDEDHGSYQVVYVKEI